MSFTAAGAFTSIRRETNHQVANDAKRGSSSWRPWPLGGSKFCALQAVSARLSLWPLLPREHTVHPPRLALPICADGSGGPGPPRHAAARRPRPLPVARLPSAPGVLCTRR